MTAEAGPAESIGPGNTCRTRLVLGRRTTIRGRPGTESLSPSLAVAYGLFFSFTIFFLPLLDDA
jgi:hypothetical protein